MKTKERLYAVIGGMVGAVLTMVVCSLSPLGAQSQSEGHFDEITCRKLRVVNEDSFKGFQTEITPLGVSVVNSPRKTTINAGHRSDVWLRRINNDDRRYWNW